MLERGGGMEPHISSKRLSFGHLRHIRPIAIIDSTMASQLIVRNLEDDLVDALRRRAAEHGRSAEAEHREILRAALLPKPRTSLKDHLLAIPKSANDEDDEDFVFEHRRDRARAVDL